MQVIKKEGFPPPSTRVVTFICAECACEFDSDEYYMERGHLFFRLVDKCPCCGNKVKSCEERSWHLVQQHESWVGIASHCGVSMDDLVAANQAIHKAGIRIGDILVIPDG